MLRLTKPEKQIAEEDIKCYVVFVDEKCETIWNDVKEINIGTIINGKYAYPGFYSYKYKQEAELFESILKREGKVEIKEAIIPKGSEYYEGVQGWSFPISKEHLEITKYCSNVFNYK